MAQYWNTTKHEDTIKKRQLTSDDIEFLLNMQKELNTQDHLSQAHPRYWTIRDYKKIAGSDLNSPDGICIYDTNSCETVYEGDNLYIKDDEDKIFNMLKEYVRSEEELKEALENSFYLTDVIGIIENTSLEIYDYEEYPVDIGMFLTHEAAIQHLKANEHNYSAKAHTYSHTALRTSEEPLWRLLSEIDWSLYT